MAVPARMALSRSLASSLPSLYNVELVGLNIEENVVTEDPTPTTLEQVLAKSFDSKPSVCFVVRRPGWSLCREHGQQLSTALADQQENVKLWGIVKENVDAQGMLEFKSYYFPFPLYRDVERAVYSAMGNRKIALTTWNPWRLWRGMKALGNRLQSKNIQGNLKGEGLIQGGVLIFDNFGILRYSYEESIGEELVMEDILAAVKAVSSCVKSTDEL